MSQPIKHSPTAKRVRRGRWIATLKGTNLAWTAQDMFTALSRAAAHPRCIAR